MSRIQPPPVRVLAAVVEREGTFLLCRRPLEKRHGGLWEFPGGKMEPGEDVGAALGRELREELGVGVSEVGEVEWSVTDPGSPFVIEFVPVGIVGEPRCIEHLALDWVALERTRTLPLAPADRRFVLVRSFRARVEACMRSHGVRSARLHGSVARGDDHPGSDLDFLVEFEEGRSLLDLAALRLDLGDRLGREVDLVTPGGVGEGLARVIREEGVQLFGEFSWRWAP